jgi:hypothetical protein
LYLVLRRGEYVGGGSDGRSSPHGSGSGRINLIPMIGDPRGRCQGICMISIFLKSVMKPTRFCSLLTWNSLRTLVIVFQGLTVSIYSHLFLGKYPDMLSHSSAQIGICDYHNDRMVLLGLLDLAIALLCSGSNRRQLPWCTSTEQRRVYARRSMKQ